MHVSRARALGVAFLMSAYVLPNIILFAAVLGLLFVVARKLPQAQKQLAETAGLPKAGSDPARILLVLRGKLRNMWQFVLEAKGLRDPLASRFRMQQLLQANKKNVRSRAVKISASHQARPATAKPLPPAPHVVSKRKVVTPSAPATVDTEVIAPLATPKNMPAHAPFIASQVISVSSQDQLMESMRQAKAHLDNRQFFEARKLLESLGAEVQNNAVYWARLGYAQYHLRVYSEAIRCYERSLLLDPSQSNRYYNLALAYEASGNRNKAVGALEKATYMSPDNPKFAQTLQALKVQA